MQIREGEWRTQRIAAHPNLALCATCFTERVQLETSANPENIAYLRTKRERMGHLLHGLDDVL